MKINIIIQLTTNEAAELVKPTRPFRKYFKKAVFTLNQLNRLAKKQHIYAYLSLLEIKQELNHFTALTTQSTRFWIKKIRKKDKSLVGTLNDRPQFKANYIVMNPLHYELLQALKQMDDIFNYHNKALWVELLTNENDYYRSLKLYKKAWFRLLTKINDHLPSKLPAITLQSYLDSPGDPDIDPELLYQALIAPFTPHVTVREIELFIASRKA